MDLGIQGKTALVFGADSGIGWNTARILLAEGATVVVSDLDQSQLDNSADQLEAPYGRLHAFAADVTSASSLADLHTRVREAVGEIDILVQSSGVAAELRDAGEPGQVEGVHGSELVEVRGEPFVVGRRDAEAGDEHEGTDPGVADGADADVRAVDLDPVDLDHDVGVLRVLQLVGVARGLVVHWSLLVGRAVAQATPADPRSRDIGV